VVNPEVACRLPLAFGASMRQERSAMSSRVLTRDRRGILTTGELMVSAVPEAARFRGCVTFRPLIGGMPEFIDCKETDATESEALQRAQLLADRHFPLGRE
jgi:hypothetical protein